MDKPVRELLIYRHGHAQDKDYASDFERELRDKGKRNAQRIGVWLMRNNKIPDYVLSSSAVRARRTAEKTLKTAGLGSTLINCREELYQATVDDLIEGLRQVPSNAGRVMLVGHNPVLEQLLLTLSRTPVPQTEDGAILTPASLALLELECDWDKLGNDVAQLQQIVYPETLPRLFPYPDIDGKESRTRPAYYYSQSSVIPYRVADNGLQVLIIASSKKKHWVIPKGIHDPGLTSQQSAAKEAFEEAGVKGIVAEQEIGAYDYPKWDASCHVKVYPMKVEQVIHEKDWEESHRGRRWVGVPEAVEKLKNPEVKRIVGLLPGWLEDRQL